MLRPVITLALAATAAGQPLPASCSGTPNTLPIWSGTPTLVAQNSHGLKYLASPANVTPPMTVLHVYGTQYEMGLAYGQLMKSEITWMLPRVMTYLEAQLNASIPDWVPPQIREALLTGGLELALNLTYEATRPFTPAHHYDTLQGMADGAGVDFMTMTRMSMIPELVKASCSIVLAWNQATAGSADAQGDAVHLRALDWDTGGPFQQYPLLVTFHPLPGNGFPFSTLGWAGMLGAITGMSSTGMGVGEKVWDAYAGTKKIMGYVWDFLLQDILQFDWDTDQALGRIATANRTCSIWVALSDRLNRQGRLVAYSDQLVQIFNDRNFPAYAAHDACPGLVFVNKHVQPSAEPCMNDLMAWGYGRLDALSMVQVVAPLEQTGDMHIAVLDWHAQAMYVSNAGPADAGTGYAEPAYVRPFLRFDMAALWNTSLPTAAAA